MVKLRLTREIGIKFRGARTAVRALSVVVMPALAMLTLCCSMTSWMACGGCRIARVMRRPHCVRERLSVRTVLRCVLQNGNGALQARKIINTMIVVAAPPLTVRSPSSILSNSSMQQMPRSASTSAPPSKTSSCAGNALFIRNI